MKINDRIKEFLLKCTYSQKLAVVLFCTFLSFTFIVGGLWYTSQGLYQQASLARHTLPFQVKISRLSNLLAQYRVEAIHNRINPESIDEVSLEVAEKSIDTEVEQFFLLIQEYIAKENSKLFRQKIQFHVDEVEDFVKEWQELKIKSSNVVLSDFEEKYQMLSLGLQNVQKKLWKFFKLQNNDDEGAKRLVDVNFGTLHDLTEQTSNLYEVISEINPKVDFKGSYLEGIAIQLSEISKQAQIQLEGISGLVDTPLERDTHNFFEDSLQKLIATIDTQVGIARSGAPSDPVLLYKTMKSALKTYSVIQDKIYSFLTDLYDTQAASMIFRLYTGYFLVFLALFTVLIIYFAKVVLQPLKHLSDAANELAIGKVNIRVPIIKKDEVGEISEAFNALAAFLENTLREVKGVSNGLLEAVQVILDVARKLERNIAIQDAELSVVKGHIKEIAVVVKEFSLLLTNVYKSINATTGFADVGRKSLSEMEHVMKQIVDASQSIVSTLNKLNMKICSINDVINTIVKIADQINLLSLNTAIQANKAGPEGKGFTVIAKKIRELSGQTASSTLDIEDTVREIISSVDASATEVNQFLEQVLLQVKDSTMLSDEFKKLIHFFQHQVEVFSSVNVDMAKQAESATELQEMLKGLSDASKKTTLSVSQFYREIESLYQSTTSLVQKIDSFTHPSYILLAMGQKAEELAVSENQSSGDT